jgi:hypothetical protein
VLLEASSEKKRWIEQVESAALFASTKSLLACMDDGRHAKEVSVGRAGLS